MKSILMFSLIALTDSIPTRFVAPFGTNNPGPRTQLGPEFSFAVYSPTYNITHPEVRNKNFPYLQTPDRDAAPVAEFGYTKGREDFLRLLKYMIPYPSNPLTAAKPNQLGGDAGLGGPMGPMTPGLIGTSRHGTIIVGGPMDVSSRNIVQSPYTKTILG